VLIVRARSVVVMAAREARRMAFKVIFDIRGGAYSYSYNYVGSM
jgi:hypothetical protein